MPPSRVEVKAIFVPSGEVMAFSSVRVELINFVGDSLEPIRSCQTLMLTGADLRNTNFFPLRAIEG